MQVVTADRVLAPWGWIDDAAVFVDDGAIVDVRPRAAIPPTLLARCSPDSSHHAVLAPGFVDAQVNGIESIDVSCADGEQWDELDRLLLRQGVTSWCPTIVSASLGRIDAALARIETAMARPPATRPQVVGVHLEGPFLGARPGAHRRDALIPFDRAWLGALPRHVVLITLGPELPGAPDVIAGLVARGVRVAIGHSAAAPDELERAVEAGATLVTHLFNAMSGLDHREPGVAAWVLDDRRLVASLIADGVHVHPTMLRLAATVLGPGRWMLVTDSVAWRASSTGAAGVGLRDGAPRLADGTLAGSALAMDAAVRTCVAAGIALDEALAAAATVPARALGLHDRGVLASGCRADLVALDHDLGVEAVWVEGRRSDHR